MQEVKYKDCVPEDYYAKPVGNGEIVRRVKLVNGNLIFAERKLKDVEVGAPVEMALENLRKRKVELEAELATLTATIEQSEALVEASIKS